MNVFPEGFISGYLRRGLARRASAAFVLLVLGVAALANGLSLELFGT